MKTLFWGAFGILLLASACSKLEELDNLQVLQEAEFAIPIVTSTIAVEELLEETNDLTEIYVDETGLLHLLYGGNVLTQTAQERFEELNIFIPPAIPISSPQAAVPLLIPNTIDLDSLVLQSLDMVYSFRNPWQEPLQMTIRFPNIAKDGDLFRFELTAPAYSGSGSPPTVTNADTPADLSGYSVTPTNDTMYIEYTAVGLNSADTLNVDGLFLTVDNFRFYYVEGVFGNQVEDGPLDTLELDFFSAWTQGDVNFTDPVVRLNVENAFGLPTESVVNKLEVITVRGEVIPLESSFVEEGIAFPFPAFDEVGEVKRAQFVFDKTNSNLDVLFSSEPLQLVYDVDAVSNPEVDPSLRGFLTDSSYYRASLEVDLPLIGTGADYLVRDTIELDLSELDNAREAEFKIVADNGIPLQMEVTYTFLDANDQVVATLLEEGELVVEGPSVDSDGNPVGVVSKTTFVPVSEAQLDDILLANRGVLNAVFSTSAGETPVRITEDQQSEVRLGARVTIVND